MFRAFQFHFRKISQPSPCCSLLDSKSPSQEMVFFSVLCTLLFFSLSVSPSRVRAGKAVLLFASFHAGSIVPLVFVTMKSSRPTSISKDPPWSPLLCPILFLAALYVSFFAALPSKTRIFLPRLFPPGELAFQPSDLRTTPSLPIFVVVSTN